MEIKEIQLFNKIVKYSQFEGLSLTSDIGRGIMMGYKQAIQDNQEYLKNKMNEFIETKTDLKDEWYETEKYIYNDILSEFFDWLKLNP